MFQFRKKCYTKVCVLGFACVGTCVRVHVHMCACVTKLMSGIFLNHSLLFTEAESFDLVHQFDSSSVLVCPRDPLSQSLL